MKTLKKILKWAAIIFVPLFVIYILIWAGISVTLSNLLNKEYARKNIDISDAASIRFGSVKISGFPFNLDVEFHDFVEENNSTIVTHSSPLVLGYNLITQTLSSHYKGESIARYKPLDSGFGVKVLGEYRIHAFVPLNSTFFRIIVLKQEPFEIVNYINDLHIKSTNVDMRDLVDNSIIIEDANLHLRLGVKHHRYYDSLEELLHAIPQDYSVKATASTKNSSDISRLVPFSIVYWAYLPFNFKYDFDAELHTDSKEFEIKEIIDNVQIKTNKMEYNSDFQNVVSKLSLTNNTSEEGTREFNIDYSSKIMLLEGFTKYLINSVTSIVSKLPSGGPAVVAKEYLRGLDLSALNIDTKQEPIDLHLNAVFTKYPNSKIEANLEDFGMHFQGAGFNFKAFVDTASGAENLKGVVAIAEWQKVISYVAKSYESVRNLPDFEIYTDDFWARFYVDFMESIANDVNHETSNLTIKFDITKDVFKSEIGKYSWPETKLLYYAKLFEHTLAACDKDRDEALKKFRMIIPSEINDPKILEKVIQPR
jgi:hypothetical protein